MRNGLILIGLLFIGSACNKIKEKKFTGAYKGTFVFSKDYYDTSSGEPPFEQVFEHEEGEASFNVVRLDDDIYIEGYEHNKISLNDLGRDGGTYLFTGGTTMTIKITDEKLEFRTYWCFCSTLYPTTSEYVFTGYKLD